jgi:L-seryl-tRNA(Ser) seleniumtransferase
MSEPTVAECIAEGADIVTFSGDKLLGGPQAGVIVGRKDLLDAIRRHPLARAMRIDKLSLAALAATLRLYRPPHDPFERVPVLRMLAESPAAIGRRAARLIKAVRELEDASVSLADGVGYTGGGALPMTELPSKLVRLQANGKSATELARRLRKASPPIVCRLADDSVSLDLRTVLPRQMQDLIGAVRDAVS